MTVRRGAARSGSIYHMLMNAGVAGQIPFCTGLNTLQHSSAFQWDSANTRLGIGGTPADTLDVHGNAIIGPDTAGALAAIELGKNSSGNRSAHIDLIGDDTYTDYGFRVIRNDTGVNATTQLASRGTGGMYLTVNEAGPLVFQTSATTRMSISSSGLVDVVGDLDVGGDLDVTGDLDVGGSFGVITNLEIGGYLDVTGDAYVEGQLGVGTSGSPNADLDVRGTARFGNGSATQPGDVVIQENDDSEAGLNLHLFNESTSGHSYTAIKCYANNGSVEGQFFTDGLGDVLSGGGLVFRTFTNHAISFGTNQTERIRLAADGKTGFGTDSPTEVVDVNSDAIRVRTSQTPASASATGDAGMICWDSNYIYVCVATDTWKRAALSTW